MAFKPVLLRYEADATQHVSELRKLERAQKGQADSAVAASARTSSALAQMDSSIGRTSSAFGGMDVSITKTLGMVGKFSLATIGLESAFKLLTGAHKDATAAGAKWATDLSSAMTSLQDSIGRIAIALDPLLSKATSLLGIAADIVAVASGDWVDPVTGRRYKSEDPTARQARLAADRQALQESTYTQSGSEVNRYLKILGGFSGTMTREQYDQLDRNQQSIARVIEENKRSQEAAGDAVFEFAEKVGEAAKRVNDLIGDQWRGGALINIPGGGGGGGGGRRPARFGDYANYGGTTLGNFFYGQGPASGGLGSAAGEGDIFGASITGALGSAELTARWNKEMGSRAENKSKLESMFGPIEDFNLYAKGFQMLQGAVSSAMTAWIDGSMSAGKAIKAFIGEAIKSLSIQMAMEALKHGAFAIGSIAFGDFRGAATHGKAAAAFAAGAAISAVAAKGLAGGGRGGGGGVPGGGGAGAAAPVGGAGGFGGGPQYQATREVIFVNDTFGMNSNRQAVQQFKRRSEEAYGAPGTKNS